MEANKRYSTVRGYTYDWDLCVKEQIAHRPTGEFRTPDAVALLDHCASPKPNGKGLNKRRSLAHVKSLCSGILSLAAIKGIIEFNPWREAKPTVKVR